MRSVFNLIVALEGEVSEEVALGYNIKAQKGTQLKNAHLHLSIACWHRVHCTCTCEATLNSLS